MSGLARTLGPLPAARLSPGRAPRATTRDRRRPAASREHHVAAQARDSRKDHRLLELGSRLARRHERDRYARPSTRRRRPPGDCKQPVTPSDGYGIDDFDNDARIAITALPLRMREHPPGRSCRTATPTVLHECSREAPPSQSGRVARARTVSELASAPPTRRYPGLVPAWKPSGAAILSPRCSRHQRRHPRFPTARTVQSDRRAGHGFVAIGLVRWRSAPVVKVVVSDAVPWGARPCPRLRRPARERESDDTSIGLPELLDLMRAKPSGCERGIADSDRR